MSSIYAVCTDEAFIKGQTIQFIYSFSSDNCVCRRFHITTQQIYKVTVPDQRTDQSDTVRHNRSEERRVGKEGGARRAKYGEKKERRGSMRRTGRKTEAIQKCMVEDR